MVVVVVVVGRRRRSRGRRGFSPEIRLELHLEAREKVVIVGRNRRRRRNFVLVPLGGALGSPDFALQRCKKVVVIIVTVRRYPGRRHRRRLVLDLRHEGREKVVVAVRGGNFPGLGGRWGPSPSSASPSIVLGEIGHERGKEIVRLVLLLLLLWFALGRSLGNEGTPIVLASIVLAFVVVVVVVLSAPLAVGIALGPKVVSLVGSSRFGRGSEFEAVAVVVDVSPLASFFVFLVPVPVLPFLAGVIAIVVPEPPLVAVLASLPRSGGPPAKGTNAVSGIGSSLRSVSVSAIVSAVGSVQVLLRDGLSGPSQPLEDLGVGEFSHVARIQPLVKGLPVRKKADQDHLVLEPPDDSVLSVELVLGRDLDHVLHLESLVDGLDLLLDGFFQFHLPDVVFVRVHNDVGVRVAAASFTAAFAAPPGRLLLLVNFPERILQIKALDLLVAEREGCRGKLLVPLHVDGSHPRAAEIHLSDRLVGFLRQPELGKDVSLVLDLGLPDHPVGSVRARLGHGGHHKLDHVLFWQDVLGELFHLPEEVHFQSRDAVEQIPVGLVVLLDLHAVPRVDKQPR
mmetsp:Transcript_8119/g.23991  ORF Transcript_8119/g.23991 Transcript_8119/m.23991 type:complete len:567 (+) Transcript_8119:353-2053(+)